MEAELHYLDDREVLGWAFGYLIATLHARSDAMTAKQRLNLKVSLAFAALMLLSSLLLRDKDQATLALWLLMALWFVPYSILSRSDPPCRNA
jgi:hypothetical protein